MKRGSSLRFIEWPMPQMAAEVRGSMAYLLFRRRVGGGLQLGGRVLHGFDDVDVAGAPAEVAGDRLADLPFAGIRIACQQGRAGEHHARRAEAALQAVLLPETFLNGVELAILLQAL